MRLTRFAAQMLIWLLICQYAAFYPGWNFIHSKVHREASAAHTAQQEKDGCHRSIFHGERDQHKGHLTENVDCASCHLITDVHEWIESTQHDSFDYSKVFPNQATSDFIVQEVSSLFASRAPPAQV